MNHNQEKKKEVWIDNIKVFACILVVLGHFFQSMAMVNMHSSGLLYQWFNKTIYYFHVPLFFICSGYIYQKYSIVDSFCSWRQNVSRKVLALGIPYFTFSIVTWCLKTVFSSQVNTEAKGFFHTLFLEPASPYWYLYCLFFLFLITPTSKNRKWCWCYITVALLFKIISFCGNTGIYALSTVLANEIWFVIGMIMAIAEFKKLFDKKVTLLGGISIGILFLGSSIPFAICNVNGIIKFALGLAACVAIICIFGALYRSNAQTRMFGFLAKYTMPIFLMHTIFAAGFRGLLFKVGIVNAFVHIAGGLIISFAGPIVAAMVMKHFKWLDVFLYPTKYIKMNFSIKSK